MADLNPRQFAGSEAEAEMHRENRRSYNPPDPGERRKPRKDQKEYVMPARIKANLKRVNAERAKRGL